MKILQVVHGFPPRSRAGAEIYTYNLSKELSKNHEVHVFYPLRKAGIAGYSLNRLYNNGLHITEMVDHQLPFPTVMKSIYAYKNSRIERIFEKLLDEINPDVVHFQHLLSLSPSLIKSVKKRGIPAVLTLHDFWFICPNIHLLKNDYIICNGPNTQAINCFRCGNKRQAESLAESLSKYAIPKRLSSKVIERALMLVNRNRKYRERKEYIKSLLLKIDKIIAPSNFLRNIFIEYGVPEDKIVYSSNGYDLGMFNDFKKKEKDSLVFGFAGGVAKLKGVHILVEAFNRIESEDVELRIYGNYDPHSDYFKELQLKARNNDRIKFMGRFDDVKEPYSEIDVLVVPSICYENCPLVMQEASISMTPMIASNLGAMPEFIENNRTGLLFEADNPDDLYEKIKVIIHNPAIIDKFRENIIIPKSMEEQAKEIEELYTDLKQL